MFVRQRTGCDQNLEHVNQTCVLLWQRHVVSMFKDSTKTFMTVYWDVSIAIWIKIKIINDKFLKLIK